MHTNTVYIVLFSSLATALIASVAVTIIIYKNSMYDDITGPLPSVSAVDTQDNVAYSHTKTSTLK